MAWVKIEMVARGLLAAAIVCVALLAGCTASVPAAPIPSGVETQGSNPEVSPEPTDTEPEQAEGSGPDAAAPSECSEPIQLAIEAAIRSQTEAFAADDFELAYSYASDTFRSNVPIRSFVAIIASSYGPLLTSSQLEFSNCFNNQALDLGIIDVRFVESGVALYGLRYIVSASDEGWRVEGASNLELIATGS
jgi:hypothetical protein